MSQIWEGDWCQHGVLTGEPCDKCEIERLRAEASKWETTSMCESHHRQIAEKERDQLRAELASVIEAAYGKTEQQSREIERLRTERDRLLFAFRVQTGAATAYTEDESQTMKWAFRQAEVGE